MKIATWRDAIDADPIEVARYIEESCARLAKPEQWTQDALCRDENGEELVIRDIDPASFCLHGGFERTYFEWTEFRDLEEDELDGIHDSAMAILWHSIYEYYPLRYDSIPHFNDAKRTTHSDVLKVLDFCDTIASAEAWGMV